MAYETNLSRNMNTAFLNGDMKPRWSLEHRSSPPRNLPDTTPDDIDIEKNGFTGIQETSPGGPHFGLAPRRG
ncbi:uncharacterized protein N7487_001578 [Penicillium crustosum]|uniref:uncharacterized protein n=1 Tax=Penicillium crustosum TaxID=36656 RepID=UPI0023A6F7C6|nr:uncharacterized protein N7487_001578 [Penicillium crustosum]KAJ5418028.1 hypothetical protein N7487_001578 [Penicillium crustosum]